MKRFAPIAILYAAVLTLPVLKAAFAEPPSVQDKAIVVEAKAAQDVEASAGVADFAEPPAPPTLQLPASVQSGELFDAAVLAAVPQGVTPTLNWRIDGKPATQQHARITSGGMAAVMTLHVGKHSIEVRGAWGVIEGGQVAITFVDLEGVIHVLGAQPPPVPPTPVPPGPPPPVPPTPVEVGKRTVVVVHESADATAERARLFTALRTGTNASYLAAKGHTLLILDDDSVDEHKQPLKLVSELVALGDALPFLAILDSNSGAVLHHRPLTPAANAEGVLTVLKENGG